MSDPAKFYYIFEGSDGCGKTTISTRVTNLLPQLCNVPRSIVHTREPGGGKFCEPVLTEIRNILKSGLKIDPLCELMLFMADRAQHREMVVKPALARGDIVIQDRGYVSSLAYQHYGRGRSLELIKSLNDLTMSDIRPTRVLWIDTPIEVALSRIQHRTDAFEATEFQKAVYHGYQEVYNSGDYPIVRIDGSQSVQKVTADVLNVILADNP